MKKLIFALALSLIPINLCFAQLVSQTNTSQDDSLISPETGIDYHPLVTLLAAGDWRKANDKTFDLFLKATGREAVGWANVESIEKMSCWDLETMDRLWREYSQDHFGFSVQFPIYISTGNIPGKIQIEPYREFGDRIGWRKNGEWIQFKENLIYNLDAPTGHLPNPRYAYELYGGRLEYSSLTKRAVDCQLPGFLVEK